MSPRCHQKQRHRRRRSSRQLNLFPAMLIVLLVLLQSFELHLCRQLMRRSDSAMEVAHPITTRHVHVPPMDKRSVAEPSVSQPEEIFSAPNDAADMSYDEYPVSDTLLAPATAPAPFSPGVKPKNLVSFYTRNFLVIVYFAFDCLPCRCICFSLL